MFFCPAVSHTEVVYHSPISLKGLMELLSVPKTMFVYQRSLSRWCFHQRRIWWHKVLRLRLLEMCIHSRCSKTEDGSHLLWKHLVVVFVELLLTMSITCRNRNYYILSWFTHLHVLPNLPQHAKSDVGWMSKLCGWGFKLTRFIKAK